MEIILWLILLGIFCSICHSIDKEHKVELKEARFLGAQKILKYLIDEGIDIPLKYKLDYFEKNSKGRLFNREYLAFLLARETNHP